MNLINCPQCETEISDAILYCPQCGYSFKEDDNNILRDPLRIQLIPRKLNSNEIKVRKRLITFTIISIILLAVIVSGIIEKNTEKNIALRKEYIYNLENIYNDLINIEYQSERICNMTERVWNNTIFKKKDSGTDKYTMKSNSSFESDFNVSIDKLYSDPDIKDDIQELTELRKKLDMKFKKIQNPRNEFLRVYEDIINLYSACRSLERMATNPSGTLVNYRSIINTNTKIAEQLFYKVYIQIPAK